MFNVSAPEFRNLDLPVYSPKKPLITKKKIHTIAPEIRDAAFVREVRMGTPPRDIKSLAELLKIADEEIALLVTECGALAMKYSWGLYPLSHIQPHTRPFRDEGAIKFLPTDYALVAEVETIRKPKAITRDEWLPMEAHINHGYEWTPRAGYRLSDISPDQFCTGTTDRISTIGLWMPDIEPRLH